MPRLIKSHTLALLIIFAALSAAGAPAALAVTGCSAADFKTARSLGDGANFGLFPPAYASADFNGDGKPDLAATDAASGAVVVLLNDGTGWLGELRRFEVQSAPSAVAAADLNGDGRADLAVTNSESDSVSVLLGGGGGQFGPAAHFAVGDDPRSVAVGDFNKDGRADLAVGNVAGADVSVLLGDGAGAFSPAAGTPSAAGGAVSSLAVADFNADGKRDLAVGTYNSGYFVLLGNGAGGFSEPVMVSGAAGTAVAAADLNGDGKADIAFGTPEGLRVGLGNGAGSFGASTLFTREVRGGVDAIALGDLDGDGKIDAAVGSSFPSGVSYFKGDGSGGFSRTRSYLARTEPNSIAVADFDGDGDRDIVAGGSLLVNAGAGVFEAPRAAYIASGGSPFGATPTDLALGDFNGDGRADLAVSHRSQSGVSPTIAILLGAAGGGFTRSATISYFPGSAINSVVTGDFNGDGKDDVAATGTITVPFSHVVSVSLSKGDGTFSAPTNITGFFLDNPWDLATGEFNGDGKLDLAVVSGSSQNYSILLGNGAGGFSFSREHSVGSRFDRVAVGDFDGDSAQDLAVTDYDDGAVVVVLDAGQFGGAKSFNVPGHPAAVTVGDFNADDKLDLAVASQVTFVGGTLIDEGRLSVLLGDGAGGFAAPAVYRVGSMPESVVAADLDGDGKTDLAVANRASSSVSVLSGDGAGAFSHAANFDIAGAPAALVAHDFDADGRLDLAALLPGAGAVGLLFGQPAEPQPCLLADDVSVTEGNAGSTEAAVNVRLSGPSGQVVKVNYRLRGNTAAEGQDFEGAAGTLTFQPGETSQTVPVGVLGDLVDELDESFTLHLSAPLNARLSDAVAKVNISDDDAGPKISINDVSVTEGDFASESGVSAVFTVTLSAPSELIVRVNYRTAAGTATAGTDFFNAAGTLSFEPGATSKTITVGVNSDRAREPNETFFVNLSDPEAAAVADGQGRGTILNDDPVPSIDVINGVGSEPPEGSGLLNVIVRLSNPSSVPVTVKFATADDTARAGADYVARAGTLTFNPGQTEQTLVFNIKHDTVDEVYETFLVNLSGPTNATIRDGQAFCQIIDNDGPAVSVNNIRVAEGNAGLSEATFTLTLSAPSPQTVGVRVTTADGTAESDAFPQDYRPLRFRQLVAIRAGATSATFTVFVNGDHTLEPDETFTVNLSEPQDCTISDGQGVATIVNDDASVRFSAGALSVNESAGKVQLMVTRAGALSAATTVGYETAAGTASDRADFNAAIGLLQFAPGEASKTITVFITNDSLVEAPETFTITMTDPSGGSPGSPSTAIVTINSDDATLGPNPIDNTAFFVRQHYRDFLGRDPEAAGLQFWTNDIEKCGADAACRDLKRQNVSAAFFLSIEFQETGYLAYRMYKAAYGDATSPNVTGTVPVIRYREFLADAQRVGRGVQVGVGDWQRQLESNKEAYALEFVQRGRFVDAFPLSLTAEEFVNQLDERAGGVLSAEERAQLVALLGQTPADARKRAQVLRRVAEDADLHRRETNRAFVLMQYYGYLRRDPDDGNNNNFGGWRFWLDKLDRFNGNFIQAEMVKAFIVSIEYRQRFGR